MSTVPRLLNDRSTGALCTERQYKSMRSRHDQHAPLLVSAGPAPRGKPTSDLTSLLQTLLLEQEVETPRCANAWTKPSTVARPPSHCWRKHALGLGVGVLPASSTRHWRTGAPLVVVSATRSCLVTTSATTGFMKKSNCCGGGTQRGPRSRVRGGRARCSSSAHAREAAGAEHRAFRIAEHERDRAAAAEQKIDELRDEVERLRSHLDF